MAIYYVTNKKPPSHNKRGAQAQNKLKFGNDFINNYGKQYSNLPLSEQHLQSLVLYIHHQLQKGHIPDVDNLSKPLVDAFSGIIYNDDQQIIKRTAIRMELKDFDFINIDATNMPYEIYNALSTYYYNKENHIILFKVDSIVLEEITIGEI